MTWENKSQVTSKRLAHKELREMTVEDNDREDMPMYPEKWLKRFTKRFEPYGILIAICALGVAFGTLWVEIDLRNRTLAALAEEKELREETLVALAEEKELRQETLVALADEKELREASLLSMLLEHFELSRNGNYSGHVAILERTARLQMDLRNLDASSMDFYFDAPEGGITLNNADLREVYFKGSDLSHAKLVNTKLNKANLREAELHRADLRNADLTDADLRQAEMYGANLSGAVLENTRLKETDISAVNFENAQGLEQRELDRACADPEEEPPMNLPKDSRTGEQLVWKGKRCPN